MDGTIAALRCEYLARGLEQTVAAGHLDEVARIGLPGALSALLDSVYGDDPAVYALRDVRAECTLQVDSAAAARRWAETLAAAIVTAIAEDPADGTNLVRFADEAEYLARYLADHVGGHAARRWYFRGLAPFHAQPTSETVRALLTGRPLMPVLVALHRHGTLAEVLGALAPGDLAELAATARSPAADDAARDAAGVWPLLIAAVEIAGTWDLWTSVPLEAADVARAHRPRAVPDWRSPAALTLVVVDILRQLAATGDVRRPTTAAPSYLATRFDWLDLPLLASGLTAAVPDIVTRGEERVLRAMADLLAASVPVRTAVRSAGPGPRAVLVLRAALAAEHPEWTDDPLADTVVARLMERWARSGGAPVDDPVLVLLTRDDRDVVQPTVAEDSPCAGVLLLLRAVAELRVPALLARAGLSDALCPALLAVARRLTGADQHDPAVTAFAGRPDSQPWTWQDATEADLATVRRELLAQARAQHLPDLDDVDLPDGKLGPERADAVLGLLALTVLRTWSRWLGRFAESSVGYLLAHFVRRPGRLRWADEELVVELEPRPLDVAISLAGYDQPMEAVPWLGHRRVVYRMDAS
jgi:hypothetical protein